jgi:hypothetical protein
MILHTSFFQPATELPFFSTKLLHATPQTDVIQRYETRSSKKVFGRYINNSNRKVVIYCIIVTRYVRTAGRGEVRYTFVPWL